MEKLSISRSNDKELRFGFRKAFIKDNRLPLEARFLLVLLMCYKGRNKACWPSQNELAERMGRSRETVRKYIRILQKNGHLKIKSRGIGRSLLYVPEYVKFYEVSSKPAKNARQGPGETITVRSIVSGNIDTDLIKKEGLCY